MANATDTAQPDKTLAKRQDTISVRFQRDVEEQFLQETGQTPQFTALEKRLAQHMFLKVDESLKTAEARRNKGKEYNWHSIDRQKLALDTVHMISLHLDPLIPNHVHPVFYFNGRTGRYDVQLQTGYVGRDYIARTHALVPVVNIIYQLVYSTDHFKPLPKAAGRPVESYEFEITNPWERGEIIGGFGYIEYEDARQNRLVLVTPRDFKRAQAAAKSDKFWSANVDEMHLKTVVHRVASKVTLDPEKVNEAVYEALKHTDDPLEASREDEIEYEARSHIAEDVIDVDAVPAGDGAASGGDADEAATEPQEEQGDAMIEAQEATADEAQRQSEQDASAPDDAAFPQAEGLQF